MSTRGDSCPNGFQVGETVSVKRYGNAVIVSGPVEEPGPFLGRYQIRYPDGKLYYARPNTLRRFEQVRELHGFMTIRPGQQLHSMLGRPLQGAALASQLHGSCCIDQQVVALDI